MAALIFRRLIQSALILLGVSFITFFLLYVLPADPVRQIAGRSATPQTVVYGYYWSEAKPALRIRSGDIVDVETMLTSTPW